MTDDRLVFNPETGELSVVGKKELINGDATIADQIAEEGFFGGPSPDDIVSLLLAAISVWGSARFFTTLIKLWIEKENGKRIRIRKGSYELEICGGMNEKEIENRIEQFKELVKNVKVDADDIEIIADKYLGKIDGGYHEYNYHQKGDK
ncbi:MAG: hypothetical protein WCO29_01500 [Nostocales cyanobacterium ELA583]|jgi:hypothetical protein